MGHGVTIFEEKKKLGGMLRYGIPAYRFPREKLDAEIASILVHRRGGTYRRDGRKGHFLRAAP